MHFLLSRCTSRCQCNTVIVARPYLSLLCCLVFVVQRQPVRTGWGKFLGYYISSLVDFDSWDGQTLFGVLSETPSAGNQWARQARHLATCLDSQHTDVCCFPPGVWKICLGVRVIWPGYYFYIRQIIARCKQATDTCKGSRCRFRLNVDGNGMVHYLFI